MFIDLLSESCEEGGISLLGNEDEPIFRGYVIPNQPEFLVIFYKLFLLRQSLDEERLFFTGHIWEMYASKVL